MKKTLLFLSLLIMLPTVVYATDLCEDANNKVKVTFDQKSEEVCSSCVAQEVETSITTLPEPTKEGYTLEGWFYKDGTKYKAGDTLRKEVILDESDPENICIKGYKDITLEAHWKKECTPPDENKVSVIFDSKGGNNIDSVSVTDGKLPKLSDPVKKGFTFKNWKYTKNDGVAATGDSIENVKEPKKDKDGCVTGYDVNLYAAYECLPEDKMDKTVVVKFNTDGGNEIKDVETTSGKLTKLETPKKKGFTFVGWFTENGVEYKEGDELVLVKEKVDDCYIGYKSITLKAKWEAVVCEPLNNASVTISFETNGGDNIPAQTVCVTCNTAGSNVSIPEVKKKKANFNGWYYDKKFKKRFSGADLTDIAKNPVYDDDGCQTGYSDVTLYAKWEDVICPKYEGEGVLVKFTTFGGTKIDDVRVCIECEYEEGTAPKVENPSKEGYDFGGWYYDPEFVIEYIGEDLTTINKNAVLDENDCVKSYEDVTLYAKFTLSESKKNKITNNIFNYNPKGGLVSMGLGLTGALILGGVYLFDKKTKVVEANDGKREKRRRLEDNNIDEE